MKKIYLQPVTEYVDMVEENDMLAVSNLADLADEGGEVLLSDDVIDADIPAEARHLFDF